jgi:nitroreductase
MSAPIIFRSHLMQQFAAAARTQSRPPIALANTTSSKRRSSSSSFLNNVVVAVASTKEHHQDHLLLLDGSAIMHNHHHHHLGRGGPMPTSSPVASSVADHDLRRLSTATSGVGVAVTADGAHDSQEHEGEELAEFDTAQKTDTGAVSPVGITVSSFQSTLLSRRTIANFSSVPPDALKLSLDRAILCAQNAPNHKHTEPTFFKRMLSPSPAIDALAEIVYNVTYKRKSLTDQENAESFAARKRDKWNRIPAYLVVVIKDQPPSSCFGDEKLLYTELPFVGPETERHLEDYAAACAATQNILLSLHSEGLGAKWATGPVISTPAFRALMGITPTDRLVALIMVGGIAIQPKPPRRRKEWDALVEDL